MATITINNRSLNQNTTEESSIEIDRLKVSDRVDIKWTGKELKLFGVEIGGDGEPLKPKSEGASNLIKFKIGKNNYITPSGSEPAIVKENTFTLRFGLPKRRKDEYENPQPRSMERKARIFFSIDGTLITWTVECPMKKQQKHKPENIDQQAPESSFGEQTPESSLDEQMYMGFLDPVLPELTARFPDSFRSGKYPGIDELQKHLYQKFEEVGLTYGLGEEPLAKIKVILLRLLKYLDIDQEKANLLDIETVCDIWRSFTSLISFIQTNYEIRQLWFARFICIEESSILEDLLRSPATDGRFFLKLTFLAMESWSKVDHDTNVQVIAVVGRVSVYGIFSSTFPLSFLSQYSLVDYLLDDTDLHFIVNSSLQEFEKSQIHEFKSPGQVKAPHKEGKRYTNQSINNPHDKIMKNPFIKAQLSSETQNLQGDPQVKQAAALASAQQAENNAPLSSNSPHIQVTIKYGDETERFKLDSNQSISDLLEAASNVWGLTLNLCRLRDIDGALVGSKNMISSYKDAALVLETRNK